MRHLPIAVRAYTERTKKQKARHKGSENRDTGWPRHVVVFDTETTIDKTQQLMFGSYRFCRWLEEGLIYDDALPRSNPKGFACLQKYVEGHSAGVISDVPQKIQLLSRAEFVEDVLHRVAYEGRAMVVGFNLPFDLSRLAVDCGMGRWWFRGGFSLFEIPILFTERATETASLPAANPDPAREQQDVVHPVRPTTSGSRGRPAARGRSQARSPV